jgi:hypothetical protein
MRAWGFCVIGFALVCATSANAFLVRTKVACRVLDDEQRPIADAMVQVMFREDDPKGPGTRTREDRRVPSDTNGWVEVVSQSDGLVFVGATKEGYYATGRRLSLKRMTEVQDEIWSQTVTLVLKRKVNPIPMGVKGGPNISAETTIPVIGKPVGYDLVVSDWVKPHGKGVTSDMIFLLKTRYVSNADCEASLTVSCPNDGDGLQSVFAPRSYETESELRFPYEAPEDKYESSVTRFMRNSPEKPFATDMRDDQSYFFRIRTRKEESKIVSAQYGIVDGNIEFSIQGTLRFRYLLNPTPSSRNVEWDGKHNLFDPETLEDLKSPGETLNTTNAPTKPRKPILEPPPPRTMTK